MRALELGTDAESTGDEKLAIELGVSVRTARRWKAGQLPESWDEARRVRFATDLYARSHAAEPTRTQGQRKAIAEALARPKYAPQAMRRAVTQLERELRRQERTEGSDRRRVSQLAADVGVTAGQLRGWLRRGQVPESHMHQFAAWAEARADEQFQEQVEKERAASLIEEAKSPALAPRLKGEKGPRRRAARAPDIKNGQGRTESDAHSGYSWDLRVEAWLSPATLDKMTRWALARRRPAGTGTRPWPRWVVTALTSVLTSSGGKNIKSPGGRRQFSRVSDRDFGTRIELNTPFSSGTVKRAGLEVAVARFRREIGAQLGGGNRVWVHGLVVRNWRVRTPSEKSAFRRREQDRYERELAEKNAERHERRREKASRATTSARRKKVTGRRSPGKSPGFSRGGKKS